MLHSRFLLAIYFICSSVYTSKQLIQVLKVEHPASLGNGLVSLAVPVIATGAISALLLVAASVFASLYLNKRKALAAATAAATEAPVEAEAPAEEAADAPAEAEVAEAETPAEETADAPAEAEPPADTAPAAEGETNDPQE